MNKRKDILGCQDFHINECFDWVSGIKLSLTDLNLVEHILLIELIPHLNDWRKTGSPFGLVESELLSSNSSQLLELVNNSVTVESLDTSIDVCWKTEERWCIEVWDFVDDADVVSNVGRLRNWNDI